MTFGRPPVPTIDTPTAADHLAAATTDGSAPLLVDVRERHEFAVARVPGAVALPISSFLLRFESLPRDRPILVLCQSGSRSLAVAGFLLRNGFADVTNVAGGLDAWARAGLEVRHGPLAAGEGDLPGE